MPPAPFVGRASALAEITGAWRAARPRVVVITGEAGSGKSRLVAEVLDRIDAAVVLAGAARTLGAAPHDWLASVLGRRPLCAPPVDPAVLAHLTQRAPEGTPPRLAPAAMLRAAVDVVRALLGTDHGVLVVEDLHDLDPASLTLVGELAAIAVPALLLVTSRPPAAPAAARTLRKLGGAPSVLRVDLRPFDARETTELIEAYHGAPPPPDTVRAALHRTDGNPFWLTELLTADALTARSLPAHVTGLLVEPLTGEPALVGTVARAAALLGDPVESDVLAHVCATDVDPALRRLLDLGMLVIAPDAAPAGPLRFRYPLLREALAHTALPAERARVHSRALALAVELGDAPARARHAAALGRAPEARAASAAAVRTLVHAGRPDAALALAGTILDLRGAASRPLLRAAAEAAFLAAHFTATADLATEWLHQIAAACPACSVDRPTDGDGRGELSVGRLTERGERGELSFGRPTDGDGRGEFSVGRLTERGERGELSFGRPTDGDGRGEFSIGRPTERGERGEPSVGRPTEVAVCAVCSVDRPTDDGERSVGRPTERYEDSVGRLTERDARGELLVGRPTEHGGRSELSVGRPTGGNGHSVDRLTEHGGRSELSVGRPTGGNGHSVDRLTEHGGRSELSVGRPTGGNGHSVDRLTEHGGRSELSVGRPTGGNGHSVDRLTEHGGRSELSVGRPTEGNGHSVGRPTERAGGDGDEAADAYRLLAAARRALGDHEGQRQALDRAAAIGRSQASTARQLAAEAELALDTEGAGPALPLAEAALTAAERAGIGIAPASVTLGAALARRGVHERGAALLRAARQLAERDRDAVTLGRAIYELLAVTLPRLDATTARRRCDEAVVQLKRAGLEFCAGRTVRLGVELALRDGDPARAEALLRSRLPIETDANERAAFAALGEPPVPGELTAREVEVLGCLAAGMSNQQVASSLGISIRTVAVHVSNLLRKTGATSRTEAALWAVRHRLAPER
ncbi:LuxR C-terminal-related transcriptional regulator [Dactylosporangium sp. AC04546]|uniref:helix-turn-helix transcriptional regulator n=1 Tax=Dactylosporangium sp. AC04546 TaxID=2862460 RepID=UPI001EE11DEB|nr:helix-turn-helix transcriptional regulator [Dactylosporangium sp. AC04546]WVK85842.1 LuxR C-terminal-related transcriptional regulator [Dactylosporangium sp. AC04546]